MEARPLSSAKTFYLKVVLPIFWIGGMSAATVLLFLDPESRADPNLRVVRWILLAFTVVFTPIILRYSASLKRVRLEGEDLFVSNYRNEIRIPLRDIQSVRELRWTDPKRVLVEIRRDTEFGPKFAFIPRFRDRWRAHRLWGEHPIVAELRALAAGQGIPFATR